jgi:uncharacterized protein (TIGR03118 family)
MKKMNLFILLKPASVCLAFSILVFSGCKKSVEPKGTAADEQISTEEGPLLKSDEGKKIGHFQQVNLVANTNAYGAAHVDPTLINAWGIAFSGGGTAWVSSQAGHVSDVYNSEGATVLGPVHIPNPAFSEGGNPTGVVFNANSADFVIPGGAARFIFVGVDGVVSAWNSAQGTHAFRKFTVPVSAYTGLALAANGGVNFLYAANFRANRIDVWDRNWNPVPMSFTDPNIPAGYAPYNIQAIGTSLYVTYAKVGPTGRSEFGVGKGYVDIYRTDGTLLKRFASKGTLNSPWGLAAADETFFKDQFDDDNDADDHGNHNGHNKTYILVGNFGDGRINVYSTDGKFEGQLRAQGHDVVIEGLWAISFPPATSTIDPHRLYFAAGPDDETEGLFGYLIQQDHD